MKIKKIGHCCLVLEVNGRRVMTDPGSWTIDGQELERNIDLVVITHEHMDHLHVDSLKKVLVNNPDAIIVTNTAVGKILGEAGIAYQKVEEGQSGEYASVYLEGHGTTHDEIYGDIGQVQNTGYFIGHNFFYPGDALTNPGKPVDVLAVPVAGPWIRVRDAIKYVLELKPRVCFPVHDGMIQKDKVRPFQYAPNIALTEANIPFKILEEGKEEEI